MNRKNIFFYFLIFLILALAIWIVYFISTKSFQCIANPLVYGIKQIKSDEFFSCTCSTLNSQEELFITKDGMILRNKYSLWNDNVGITNFTKSIKT